MKSKQNKIIAYALDFVSYLVENGAKIDRAILFGSVVTGEFDKESDADIFIETTEKEDKIQDLLKEFEKTKKENWELKGIENVISLKIGNLSKWPALKRSIQSNGLLLYGQYNEIPDKINVYTLFVLDFENLGRLNKVSIWRKLYGYSQKVKNKKYVFKGLVSELRGIKLKRGVISIPTENTIGFKDFLKKNKIRYKLYEIWSDSF